MQKSSTKKSSDNDRPTFVDAVGVLSVTGLKVLGQGLQRIPFKKAWFWSYIVSPLVLLAYVIVHYGLHFTFFMCVFPEKLATTMILNLYELGLFYNFSYILLWLFVWACLFLGIKPFIEWKRCQNALDAVSIKSGLGKTPVVQKVIPKGPYRKAIIVQSKAIGLDQYETKRAALAASFGEIIESIEIYKGPNRVKIELTKKQLPEKCLFKDLIDRVKTPFSFVVGESLGGTIIQDIRKLPHALIGGSTGGGKSIFFKQVLLGLLKTSSNIQLALVDLKKGVEIKEFSALPNVSIAKNEREAVDILSKVECEMDERFEYLESKGYKSIDPKRDKMDLIVVGVDEASILYGKVSRRNPSATLIEKATISTDRIAKLGRAAGIHLVLSTQRPEKLSIPTSVMENLEGRMAFRMKSIQGSISILGNKKACTLPKLGGRGIWSSGSSAQEIQGPFVEDEEIESIIEEIKYDYDSGKKSNQQEPISGFRNIGIQTKEMTENIAA